MRCTRPCVSVGACLRQRERKYRIIRITAKSHPPQRHILRSRKKIYTDLITHSYHVRRRPHRVISVFFSAPTKIVRIRTRNLSNIPNGFLFCFLFVPSVPVSLPPLALSRSLPLFYFRQSFVSRACAANNTVSCLCIISGQWKRNGEMGSEVNGALRENYSWWDKTVWSIYYLNLSRAPAPYSLFTAHETGPPSPMPAADSFAWA